MQSDFIQLQKDLRSLHRLEKKIGDTIKAKGYRFSINKFTADLGEYYAAEALRNRISGITFVKQESTSNSSNDLFIVINKTSQLYKDLDKKEITVEVKSRRGQIGPKYLGGVTPAKFDLLCVVDINSDYSLNKIHLVKSETAAEHLDIKRKRLLFKESMAFFTIEK